MLRFAFIVALLAALASPARACDGTDGYLIILRASRKAMIVSRLEARPHHMKWRYERALNWEPRRAK